MTTPAQGSKDQTQYRMIIQWPDTATQAMMHGSAQSLYLRLSFLPAWLAMHPPFSAPVMIEIHEDEEA